MLKVGVLVSGGGTNLQAILDAIDSGKITNAEVSLVISNNPGAYALERAKKHNIEAVCISPKQFENREEFHKALLAKLKESGSDCSGRILGSDPVDDRRSISKQDHQHSPISDPVILRCRLLWTSRT